MTERKSLHWKAFLLALGISTAVFLPFLLYNGGYFIFIGDFNAQQIPFYKLVHHPATTTLKRVQAETALK